MRFKFIAERELNLSQQFQHLNCSHLLSITVLIGFYLLVSARRISGAGIVGVLSAPSPSNACIPLQALDSAFPTFLLIERGDCNFVTKVENAQAAGYAAALVYNNEDDHDLVTSKCL